MSSTIPANRSYVPSPEDYSRSSAISSENGPSSSYPRVHEASSRYNPSDTASSNINSNNKSNNKYADLPAMLRDCAVFVERTEFHPTIYQALGLLHQYAGENAGKSPSTIPASGGITTATANSMDDIGKEGESTGTSSAHVDRTVSPTPTTTSTSSGKELHHDQMKQFSKTFGKTIGFAFKGTEKVLGEAFSKITVSHNRSGSSSNTEEWHDGGLEHGGSANAASHNSSSDWCDEHFIRVSLSITH